jgi:transcriptional regulator with XRE-family HTH domain
MSPRPVFHGQIGAELRELREARGWSQSQAVHLAGRRHLPAVSVQQLRFLEEGRTKHPDADILRSVAGLYGLEYQDLVARYVRANYGSVKVALDAPPAAPLDHRTWKLLEDDELPVLEAWRRSTAEGRQGALAVLGVSKKPATQSKRLGGRR